MRFDVHKQLYAPAGAEHAQIYRELIEFAQEAERLGYSGYWTTNHHFGSDPDYRPFGAPKDAYDVIDYDLVVDPFLGLSFIAANTTKLRLGTALALALYHHPVQLLEQAAMLDVFSGGRLDLGIGKGAAFRPDALFGAPKDLEEQNQRYDATIELVERAWAGAEVEFREGALDLPRFRLVPLPIQQPPPLFMAVASDGSARRAGEKGLPYVGVTWPLANLDRLEARRQIYLDAADAAGKDVAGYSNPHVIHMYIGESDGEAREVAERYVAQGQYAMESYYEFQRSGASGAAFEVEHGAGDVIGMATESLLDQALFGSAETVTERLREYERRAELSHLILHCNYGAMPQEMSLQSLRRFAQAVVPNFADRSTRT